MALQHDIKALIDAGRLPKHWTANDLQGQPSLTEKYRDTYLATHPANRSAPIAGMPQLGIGNHVANGATALFLRVGMRDGALLFALQDQGMQERAPIPQRNDVEDADGTPDEWVNDSDDDLVEGTRCTRIAEAHHWSENGDTWLSSDETVKALVEMMKGVLGSGPPIAHCYRHRRPAYDWQCLGLLDAAAQYRFPILGGKFQGIAAPGPFDTLAANSRLLTHFQSDLRLARHTKNQVLAVDTATDIQTWGLGAYAGPNIEAIHQANAHPGGFLGYLDLCEKSFGNGTSIDLTPFTGSPHRPRSNAGFTKIYSLAFDKFIIYDSRVMAALGLIVVRMLALRGLIKAAVPAGVAFIIDAPAADARRNPNCNWFKIIGFPQKASSSEVEHLKWNIRTNALLTRVLAGTSFEVSVMSDPVTFPVTPLRALEAALFMIGYDLGGNWPHHN